MMIHQLRLALRHLKLHAGASAVKILGLSLSLAVALLIIAFLRDQALHDHFHAMADRIYRVTTEVQRSDGSVSTYATSPRPLAAEMAASIPQIETVVRLRRLVEATNFQDASLGVRGFYADSTFLEVFDFPLLHGDRGQALRDPNSVVLSENAALRLFGDADAVGRTLEIERVGLFTVTGIFGPTRRRSHLEFELIASGSGDGAPGATNALSESWQDLEHYTYIVVRRGASREAAEALLSNIADRGLEEAPSERHTYTLQAVTDINLGPVLAREAGRVTPWAFGVFLGVLASLIVLAASVNYVNLSIAQSFARTKEIGLRKTLGAFRSQLFTQFLVESVVISAVALMFAFLLFAGVLLPRWNMLELVQTDFGPLILQAADAPGLILLFVGAGIALGVGAGLYPALYVSGLRPLYALKGGLDRPTRFSHVKRGLIIFQFALSLLFLISTVLIYQQSLFLLTTDFGFEHTDRFNVELNDVPRETVYGELMRHPDVVDVSFASALPAVTFPRRSFVSQSNSPDSTRATIYAVDPRFLGNLGLHLEGGRNFDARMASDRTSSVMLNEAAIRALGLGDPDSATDHSIRLGGNSFRVVGVVRDFQFDFLWNPVSPLVLRYDPGAFRFATVQYRPGTEESVRRHLMSTWQHLGGGMPPEVSRFDDQIDANYSDFQDFVWMLGLLAGLAIVIASLGLLAMAHYQTARRTKEIGIRKVLGSTVFDVVVELSKGFVVLLAPAVLMGVPLAWIANRAWLQIMANRISMEPVVFLICTAALCAVAIGAVASQTIRGALANPAQTLRYE